MAKEIIETSDSSSLETDTQAQPAKPVKIKRSIGEKIRAKLSMINVYFLMFLMLLLVSLILVFFLWRASSEDNSQDSVELETLSQEALDELSNKNASIGNSQQTLTVSSNSIFDGRVLIRDSLDVAGTINVGGALSLPGITVSGTSSFEEVEVASNLTIAGNASVQGSLNVQQDLNVSGNTNFSGNLSAGSLSVDSLNLNGDLSFSRHIDAGGGIPGASPGSSIGSGGTVSVNGSDTAGTITINTGSSPSTGTLVRVTFVNSFNQTPHIAIGPVGANSGSIGAYLGRTTSSFTIGASTAPPANTTLTFDYIAID